MYESVAVSKSGQVGTVLFNRPERRNAHNWFVRRELKHAVAELDADESVRAVVVGGVGRDFCAGADLVHGAATFDAARFEAERESAMARLPCSDSEFWEMSTPIIAAMSGAAVGVGITLALEFDIRIADSDAKLGFIFNRRGVIPELNAHWLLPRLVGGARALELMLSGRMISGQEAADIGLVSQAVPSGSSLLHAQRLAADIATNTSPLSAALIKRLTYDLLEEPSRQSASLVNKEAFEWASQQADAVEGVQSFVEKRSPAWQVSKREAIGFMNERERNEDAAKDKMSE
jgi:enoyl-CoA hydratase/carnithine racemase